MANTKLTIQGVFIPTGIGTGSHTANSTHTHTQLVSTTARFPSYQSQRRQDQSPSYSQAVAEAQQHQSLRHEIPRNSTGQIATGIDDVNATMQHQTSPNSSRQPVQQKQYTDIVADRQEACCIPQIAVASVNTHTVENGHNNLQSFQAKEVANLRRATGNRLFSDPVNPPISCVVNEFRRHYPSVANDSPPLPNSTNQTHAPASGAAERPACMPYQQNITTDQARPLRNAAGIAQNQILHNKSYIDGNTAAKNVVQDVFRIRCHPQNPRNTHFIPTCNSPPFRGDAFTAGTSRRNLVTSQSIIAHANQTGNITPMNFPNPNSVNNRSGNPAHIHLHRPPATSYSNTHEENVGWNIFNSLPGDMFMTARELGFPKRKTPTNSPSASSRYLPPQHCDATTSSVVTVEKTPDEAAGKSRENNTSDQPNSTLSLPPKDKRDATAVSSAAPSPARRNIYAPVASQHKNQMTADIEKANAITQPDAQPARATPHPKVVSNDAPDEAANTPKITVDLSCPDVKRAMTRSIGLPKTDNSSSVPKTDNSRSAPKTHHGITLPIRKRILMKNALESGGRGRGMGGAFLPPAFNGETSQSRLNAVDTVISSANIYDKSPSPSSSSSDNVLGYDYDSMLNSLQILNDSDSTTAASVQEPQNQGESTDVEEEAIASLSHTRASSPGEMNTEGYGYDNKSMTESLPSEKRRKEHDQNVNEQQVVGKVQENSQIPPRVETDNNFGILTAYVGNEVSSSRRKHARLITNSSADSDSDDFRPQPPYRRQRSKRPKKERIYHRIKKFPESSDSEDESETNIKVRVPSPTLSLRRDTNGTWRVTENSECHEDVSTRKPTNSLEYGDITKKRYKINGDNPEETLDFLKPCRVHLRRIDEQFIDLDPTCWRKRYVNESAEKQSADEREHENSSTCTDSIIEICTTPSEASSSEDISESEDDASCSYKEISHSLPPQFDKCRDAHQNIKCSKQPRQEYEKGSALSDSSDLHDKLYIDENESPYLSEVDDLPYLEDFDEYDTRSKHVELTSLLRHSDINAATTYQLDQSHLKSGRVHVEHKLKYQANDDSEYSSDGSSCGAISPRKCEELAKVDNTFWPFSADSISETSSADDTDDGSPFRNIRKMMQISVKNTAFQDDIAETKKHHSLTLDAPEVRLTKSLKMRNKLSYKSRKRRRERRLKEKAVIDFLKLGERSTPKYGLFVYDENASASMDVKMIKSEPSKNQDSKTLMTCSGDQAKFKM